MRRTMNLWTLLAVVVCVLTAFFVYNGNLQSSVNELNEIYEQDKLRVDEYKNQRTKLQETLAASGNDSFVENQARTLYGYMMQDEIRFVITNPEALYGEEGVPSR